MKFLLLIFILIYNLQATEFRLQAGWNLVGTQNSIDDINSKIPIASLAWKYDDSKWFVASPNQSYNIDSFPNKLTSLNAGDGFWLYMSSDYNLSLEYANLNDSNITIFNHWNLVALKVNHEVKVSEYFNNPKINLIWKYTNGLWQAYSPNPEISDLITQSEYKPIETINPSEGFWIQSDENVTIVFDEYIEAKYDIAHHYGKATQGGSSDYFYYEEASLAIDANSSSYNHTASTGDSNWLQVELPSKTIVSKIVVQGRNSNTQRLDGAEVFLSDKPYSQIESLNDSNKIADLLGTGSEQIFDLNNSIPAKYIIVKAMEGNNLHLASLEVYGQLLSLAEIDKHQESFLLANSATVGDVVTTINVLDYQDDNLSYDINSSSFSIDSSGKITVNKALIPGEYNLKIEINDGSRTVYTSIKINVTAFNAIENALSSGLVEHVTSQELLEEIREEIILLRDGNSLLRDLYKDETIAYDPTNRSQLINLHVDSKKVFPILQGNAGKVLAVAGEINASRFAAFGAAPMEAFEDANNLSYEIQFKRLLSWLISNEVNSSTIADANMTLALSFTQSDTNDIKNWLTKNYTKWELLECNNDASDLESCYENADLIITGWQTDENNTQTVKSTLTNEIKNKTPILYLHTWYEAKNSVADAIGNLFGFSLPNSGNYWSKDSVNFLNVDHMQSSVYTNLGYEAIDTLMTRFQNNKFEIDLSLCDDSGGGANCEYENIFGTAVDSLRNIITNFDEQKTPLFKSDDFRLQKLLILLGDKYRQDVVYPMDKVKTNNVDFFQSLYADYSVYNYRLINKAQKDMGNFSRSDFSHITPSSKTIHLRSKKSFRSTGIYALPGQTMRVTRNDSSNLVTKVFINSLRSGATHEFEENGYKRPKFLQTPKFIIESGETIEITSPYGGPVHISFDTNDLNVSFTFENIGEHAYWSSSLDDNSFTEKLNAGEFDWAEVVTSGFEVHSKLEKMRESVMDEKWGTASVLADATKIYMSNFPHVLAGFKGPGIDTVDEIHDFAKEHNLTIETLDKVKHMNADQATCGYGCSGNPYDAYWNFNPVGHGDVHELGHGLEKSRFIFEDFELHSITNHYSYYTKSQYNKARGFEATSCQNLPFKEVFDSLQASVNETNSTNYLQTNLWENSGWSQQVLVLIQAMMHTQKQNKLDNGWHLLARLHILEREIKRVKEDWENRKNSIGFSLYSIDDFNVIGKNDWLLISLSYAGKIDFSNYLAMMGIEYTQKALDQVNTFGFSKVPKEFFISTSNGYCKEDQYGGFLAKETISIDGATVWIDE